MLAFLAEHAQKTALFPLFPPVTTSTLSTRTLAFLAALAQKTALSARLWKNNHKNAQKTYAPLKKAARRLFRRKSMCKVRLLPGEKIESLMLGDLKIIQNDNLYKFTSDSVLLSRFAPVGKKKVLDLCSGSGIVGLHYYGVNLSLPPTLLSLCEIQPSLAEMSKKSIALNGLEKVFEVQNIPLQQFKGRGYDLVLCNPPYKKAGSGFFPSDEHISTCRAELKVTLEEIIDSAYRALDIGGSFCICHKTERAAELIFEAEKRGFCSARLTPVCAKAGEQPYLVLAEFLKGKKTPFRLTLPVVNDAKNFSGE